MPKPNLRSDGRADLTPRPLSLTPAVNPYAEGSAMAAIGRTKVIAVASVLESTPGTQRLVPTTTRCTLLPRSTALPPSEHEAQAIQLREIRAIEQLCDRSFAAAVAQAELSNLAIEIDCSVLCADGGVAGAAVAAGWVALYQALGWATAKGLLPSDITVARMAAVSAGILDGRTVIDLVGAENGEASFRAILVFDSQKRLVTFDGVSEGDPPAISEVEKLIAAAQDQVDPILREQERAALELD